MGMTMSKRKVVAASAVGGLCLVLGGITVAAAQGDGPRGGPGDDATATTVVDDPTSTSSTLDGTTPTTVDDCLRGDGTVDDRCLPGSGASPSTTVVDGRDDGCRRGDGSLDDDCLPGVGGTTLDDHGGDRPRIGDDDDRSGHRDGSDVDDDSDHDDRSGPSHDDDRSGRSHGSDGGQDDRGQGDRSGEGSGRG